MSYLAQPRIHFSGSFQADVSTVNNSVLRYDSANFHPAWQKRNKNGNWNPDGSGSFRLIDCRVTGAQLDGHHLTRAGQDPVIGAVISGADGRVAGKLVDLDPQQQSVSEIWGLQMRLTDRRGNDLFSGDYKVAPFMDLWKRQQTSEPGDQTLASFYQSVLQKVDWHAIESSPVLHALRESSEEGLLSIRFNVFGFDRNPDSDRFTMGRVVGTIGPAGADEPDHFVFGRHLWPDLQRKENGELNPVLPKQGVYGFAAQVDRRRLRLSVDLGNALPIVASQGQLEDIGELLMAVLPDESIDNGAFLKDSELALIGSVDYRSPRWYERTAGVVDFEYSGCEEARKLIDRHPLALVKAVSGRYQVLVRETRDGLYVRTDRFVQRLNPSDSTPMTVYASQYGRPLRTRIDLVPYNKMIGGGADHEQGDPPEIGVPECALGYYSHVDTDASGRATFPLSASSCGPKNHRGYIDGQVYGLACRFDEAPENYQYNPWVFLSVLVWDAYPSKEKPIPEHPTWVEHIEPILKQYGILYPIMSHYLVDLGNYESVKKHLEILRLAFSLPVSNPNYMPVTRDLSDRKRATLLRWISQGAPFGEGEPVQAGAPAESGGEHLAEGMGGKTEFLNSLDASRE